jgi:formylglycine-generating enzyme
MNVWQGTFPATTPGPTGGAGPAPSTLSNDHGLYNTTGNVWECHASYCRRYRVSARQRHGADSSAGNLGFRLAASALSP